MRLFVAINLSEAMRSRLFALTSELRTRSSSGNFCLPENLHLTLAFLGECDASQAKAAENAMEAVCFEPFGAQAEHIGRFRRDGGDIWWAGLQKSQPLLDLQRELMGNLSAEGFALEKRPFKPHITLARKVITDASPWQIEPFGETVMAIDLMRSDRVAGKLEYTSMHKNECQTT
jgi:2'-5' RNA ligase